MLLYLCMAEYHDPVLYVINNMFRDMHETNLIIRDILLFTPGKLPEQFGGVAWLDVTYSVAGGDLFGGSTWLNQI